MKTKESIKNDLRSDIKKRIKSYDIKAFERIYKSIKEETLHNQGTELDEFIDKYMPENLDVSIQEIIEVYRIPYDYRLIDRLIALGLQVKDTFKGYMLSEEDSNVLIAIIKGHFSIQDVFYEIAKDYDLNTEVKILFNKFVRAEQFSKEDSFLKRNYIDIYYLKLSRKRETSDKISDWISLFAEFEGVPKGCLDVKNAAAIFGIEPYNFIKILKKHPTKYIKQGIFYFPYISCIRGWEKCIQSILPFEILLKKIINTKKLAVITKIPEILDRALDNRSLSQLLISGDLLPVNGNYRFYYKLSNETRIMNITNEILGEFELYNLRSAARTLNMRYETIIRHIESGLINSVNNSNYINKNEMGVLMKYQDNYVGLYSFLREKISFSDSLFSFKCKNHRDYLIDYLEEHDWFKADKINSKDVFFAEIKNEDYLLNKNELQKIDIKDLKMWFDKFNKSNKEKLYIILDNYKNDFPLTCTNYLNFVKDEKVIEERSTHVLLDFLLSKIKKELCDYNDEEFEQLISDAPDNLSFIARNLLSKFQILNKKNTGASSSSAYIPRKEKKEQTYKAYPYKDFMIMAWLIFNNDSMKENKLIEKALSSEVYADTWVFIAMYFFRCWRGTDIRILPLPENLLDKNEIRSLLEESDDNYSSFTRFSDELVLRVNLELREPQKLRRFYYMPWLDLFIPQSAKGLFGLMLAIAGSYHIGEQPGSQFINGSNELYRLRKLFGERFACALGYKNFHLQSANRSYLQGIELLNDIDDVEGKPKGYLIAAIARGHKFGYGTLAETPDIYLRDANYSGYKPEFILFEMYERGVFSFVFTLLLKIYANKDFMELPIKKQTEIIKIVGLSTNEIENLSEALKISIIKSKEVVKDVVNRLPSLEFKIGDILQRIVSGYAVSKNKDCLCLITAMGLNCMYIDQENPCLGCDYCIMTKSIAHQLGKEYKRLLKAMKKETNEDEKKRLKIILKEVMMPLITEYSEFLKQYNDEDQMKCIYNLLNKKGD